MTNKLLYASSIGGWWLLKDFTSTFVIFGDLNWKELSCSQKRLLACVHSRRFGYIYYVSSALNLVVSISLGYSSAYDDAFISTTF
jgi:hypothetical protein